jgi:PPOX class probable F420-dependent enzyme
VPPREVGTELRRRVEAERVARLATVDRSGRPHAVPVCFVVAGDTLYSAVDSKPKRSLRLKRLANVRANPAVEVLVDHYEDDWSRLWWVRLRGNGRILERGEERERALRLLHAKYPQYEAAPPSGPVLAVEIREWRVWDPHGTTEPDPERAG